MSWATCYSGSNNVYLNKPPLMSDGRIFNNLANDYYSGYNVDDIYDENDLE